MFLFLFLGAFARPAKRTPELRDESQQIAAWQLLYRVQHPAPVPKSSADDSESRHRTSPKGETSSTPEGDGAGPFAGAAERPPALWLVRRDPANGVDRLIKSHRLEPLDSRDS